MHTLVVVLMVMFGVSLILFAYVGWRIKQRRQALRHVSIDERRYLRKIMMVATVVLFTAFTALGSLLVMQ